MMDLGAFVIDDCSPSKVFEHIIFSLVVCWIGRISPLDSHGCFCDISLLIVVLLRKVIC